MKASLFGPQDRANTYQATEIGEWILPTA